MTNDPLLMGFALLCKAKLLTNSVRPLKPLHREGSIFGQLPVAVGRGLGVGVLGGWV